MNIQAITPKTLLNSLLAGAVLVVAHGLSPSSRLEAGEISAQRGDLDLGTIVNGGDACSSGLCSITGGTKAGSNLFHRFRSFDTRGEAITGVSINNGDSSSVILAVTDPLGSFINKSIGLTNTADLLMLSPGGIQLGGGASFTNVGSLSLSTSSRARMGDLWFSALSSSINDVKSLTGTLTTDDKSFATLQGDLDQLGLSENGSIRILSGILEIDKSLLLDAQDSSLVFESIDTSYDGFFGTLVQSSKADIQICKNCDTSETVGALIQNETTINSYLQDGDLAFLASGDIYFSDNDDATNSFTTFKASTRNQFIAIAQNILIKDDIDAFGSPVDADFFAAVKFSLGPERDISLYGGNLLVAASEIFLGDRSTVNSYVPQAISLGDVTLTSESPLDLKTFIWGDDINLTATSITWDFFDAGICGQKLPCTTPTLIADSAVSLATTGGDLLLPGYVLRDLGTILEAINLDISCLGAETCGYALTDIGFFTEPGFPQFYAENTINVFSDSSFGIYDFYAKNIKIVAEKDVTVSLYPSALEGGSQGFTLDSSAVKGKFIYNSDAPICFGSCSVDVGQALSSVNLFFEEANIYTSHPDGIFIGPLASLYFNAASSLYSSRLENHGSIAVRNASELNLFDAEVSQSYVFQNYGVIDLGLQGSPGSIRFGEIAVPSTLEFFDSSFLIGSGTISGGLGNQNQLLTFSSGSVVSPGQVDELGVLEFRDFGLDPVVDVDGVFFRAGSAIAMDITGDSSSSSDGTFLGGFPANLYQSDRVVFENTQASFDPSLLGGQPQGPSLVVSIFGNQLPAEPSFFRLLEGTFLNDRLSNGQPNVSLELPFLPPGTDVRVGFGSIGLFWIPAPLLTSSTPLPPLLDLDIFTPPPLIFSPEKTTPYGPADFRTSYVGPDSVLEFSADITIGYSDSPRYQYWLTDGNASDSDLLEEQDPDTDSASASVTLQDDFRDSSESGSSISLSDYPFGSIILRPLPSEGAADDLDVERASTDSAEQLDPAVVGQRLMEAEEARSAAIYSSLPHVVPPEGAPTLLDYQSLVEQLTRIRSSVRATGVNSDAN